LLSIHSTGTNLLTLQLARKTGWLSAVNFTVFMFFSMKNTPLAKLTGYSYERLNVFHRWIATVAWIEGAVHTIAIADATSRLRPSQLHILIAPENILGIVCLTSWFITMMAFPILKKKGYEWFYSIHMLMFPLITISLFLHNRHAQWSVVAGIIFYIIDRIIRTDRLIWHNRHAKWQKATLKILPDSSVLVSVPRGNMQWLPGAHAFINIPRIQYWQSHPFTIKSVGDEYETVGSQKYVQFLIKPVAGFTKDLFKQAMKTPEEIEPGLTQAVTAYVDGPYGGDTDFSTFTSVVLISAGSGITFCLPVALSLVRTRKVRHLVFCWSVRDMRSIEGIRGELEVLAAAARESGGIDVTLKLQITGKTPASGPSLLQRAKTFAQLKQPKTPYLYDLYRADANLSLPGNLGQNNRSTVDFSKFSGDNPDTMQYRAYNPDLAGSGTPEQARMALEGRPPLAGRYPEASRPYPTHHDSQDSQASQRTSSSYTGSTIKSPIDSSLQSPVSPPLESPPPLLSMGRYSTDNHPSVPGHRSMDFAESGLHPAGIRRDRDFDELSETTVTPGSRRTSVQQARQRATNPLLAGNDSDSEDEKKPLKTKRVSVGGDPLKEYYAYGRPNIPNIIKDAIAVLSDTDTMAVGACGVTAMTDEVRQVVGDNISRTSPSISLFCEEFGW
jgi:predicted ferric reductase